MTSNTPADDAVFSYLCSHINTRHSRGPVSSPSMPSSDCAPIPDSSSTCAHTPAAPLSVPDVTARLKTTPSERELAAGTQASLTPPDAFRTHAGPDVQDANGSASISASRDPKAASRQTPTSDGTGWAPEFPAVVRAFAEQSLNDRGGSGGDDEVRAFGGKSVVFFALLCSVDRIAIWQRYSDCCAEYS